MIHIKGYIGTIDREILKRTNKHMIEHAIKEGLKLSLGEINLGGDRIFNRLISLKPFRVFQNLSSIETLLK